MIGHLTDAVVTMHVKNAVAAGTSNQTTSVVDLNAVGGGDAIRFIADVGALTAGQVTKMKVQYSDDNVTFSDVAGSETAAMADGDSNKLLICDVVKPLHRYFQAVVERGTQNAVINCVIAEVYRARKQAVTQDATVSQATKV